MRRALLTVLFVTSSAALAACGRTAKLDAEPASPPASSSPVATATPAVPAPAAPKESVVAAPAAPSLSPSETSRVAQGSNAFAFDLWQHLDPSVNSAFSPASISVAFAMLHAGARGETSAEIQRVLHFPGDGAATASSWGSLSRALTAPGRPITLRIANRLYGERTFHFLPAYLEQTRTAFEAPLEPVDFLGAADAARERINAWVEEKTEKRIKDLVPPRALDESTRLVLVNAVYFLADWEHPFKKSATRDAPFEVSAASKKNVPTMHQETYFRVGRAAGARVLEMPYAGGSVSMVVVLPESRTGLLAVEKSLSPATFATWTSSLSPSLVEVEMPRFEVKTATIPLARALGTMGMKTAFEPQKADLRGIADPPDPKQRLFVASVLHKAFVKVDEKGTEAAAATALAMGAGGGAPPKPEPFHVDHPFLWFLVDKASGLVLFAGRVVDPAG